MLDWLVIKVWLIWINLRVEYNKLKKMVDKKQYETYKKI